MRLDSSSKSSFRDFLYALPPQEKKRLIEAVICPETGGKCSVRYATPFDYLDDEDIRGMPKDELFELQKDRLPIVDLVFNIDLNKIETLITGLNNRGLLNSVVSR